MEAFFSLLIQGAGRWYKQKGLTSRHLQPESVSKYTSQYFAGNDVVQQFILDRCVVEKSARNGSKTLYEAYAASFDGQTPLTKPKFVSKMKDKGFEYKKLSINGIKDWGFWGVRLKNKEEVDRDLEGLEKLEEKDSCLI